MQIRFPVYEVAFQVLGRVPDVDSPDGGELQYFDVRYVGDFRRPPQRHTAVTEMIGRSLRASVREALSDQTTQHLQTVGAHFDLQFGEHLLVVFGDACGHRLHRCNIIRYDP